jgi:hypothetical protein
MEILPKEKGSIPGCSLSLLEKRFRKMRQELSIVNGVVA